MVFIPIPKPSKNAINPNRPVNALLKAQIVHLHDAERMLPLKYRTDIYINAIQTEGEAAEYIQAVTEAIHTAHDEAATKRARPILTRKRPIEIAAVADERAERKSRKRNKKRNKTRSKTLSKTRNKKAASKTTKNAAKAKRKK